MRFSSRVDHIGGGAVAAWDIHNAAQAAKRRGEDAEQIRLKLNHPNAKEYRFYVSYHSL